MDKKEWSTPTLESFERPSIPVEGQDGNIYAIMASATSALRKAGLPKEFSIKMQQEIEASEDYNAALRVVMKYVNFE